MLAQRSGTRRLWVTELGTYGAPELDFTFLQALYRVILAALLPTIGRVDVVLPYCLVCGDETGSAYQRNQRQQPWSTTPSGLLHELVFQALRDADRMVPLFFSPNSELSSESLVGPGAQARSFLGWAACDGIGIVNSVVLFNLSPGAVEFDLSGIFPAARSLVVRMVAPPPGGFDQMILPHEPPTQTQQEISADSHVLVSAYAVSSIRLANNSRFEDVRVALGHLLHRRQLFD
mmetsp:Transcript_55431/g.179825  ORF Transcript_55431/g.179825 Transcript_55431/m.179825 type:complete len:233 (+) Transcript_55431:424-1122(+)